MDGRIRKSWASEATALNCHLSPHCVWYVFAVWQEMHIAHIHHLIDFGDSCEFSHAKKKCPAAKLIFLRSLSGCRPLHIHRSIFIACGWSWACDGYLQMHQRIIYDIFTKYNTFKWYRLIIILSMSHWKHVTDLEDSRGWCSVRIYRPNYILTTSNKYRYSAIR